MIHKPRAKSEPPARLVLLRAEGWTLPGDSGCHEGMQLVGGAQCELRVPSGSKGTLVFRFAAGEGLQPQPVRLPLGGL